MGVRYPLQKKYFLPWRYETNDQLHIRRKNKEVVRTRASYTKSVWPVV